MDALTVPHRLGAPAACSVHEGVRQRLDIACPWAVMFGELYEHRRRRFEGQTVQLADEGVVRGRGVGELS